VEGEGERERESERERERGVIRVNPAPRRGESGGRAAACQNDSGARRSANRWRHQ